MMVFTVTVGYLDRLGRDNDPLKLGMYFRFFGR